MPNIAKTTKNIQKTFVGHYPKTSKKHQTNTLAEMTHVKNTPPT
jgi:hypothetical protein